MPQQDFRREQLFAQPLVGIQVRCCRIVLFLCPGCKVVVSKEPGDSLLICFPLIQRRKRLFIVASDVPFSFPEGKDGRPPPFVASVLDPPSTDFQYLSEKGKAYLDRRKKWGVRIYRRKDRAFLGTLPRSYGHMQSWKHTMDEGNGRLRNLTFSEAFRIQSFDPFHFDCTGLSRRQLMYMAGNAIDRKMLEALLRSILGKSSGNIVP